MAYNKKEVDLLAYNKKEGSEAKIGTFSISMFEVSKVKYNITNGTDSETTVYLRFIKSLE